MTRRSPHTATKSSYAGELRRPQGWRLWIRSTGLSRAGSPRDCEVRWVSCNAGRTGLGALELAGRRAKARLTWRFRWQSAMGDAKLMATRRYQADPSHQMRRRTLIARVPGASQPADPLSERGLSILTWLGAITCTCPARRMLPGRCAPAGRAFTGQTGRT